MPLPPSSDSSAAAGMPQQTRFPSSLVSIVLVALAIRLVVAAFLLPEQLDPQRDHWPFGYETGRIARSIAEGRGFSSPLFEDTGPTAWMTPVYPYFVAGVFKLFGVYTRASAVVLLALQCLISASNCVPIFYLARKLFGSRVALWSGWAWAFFPYGIYFPAERIWSTWLSTTLLTVLFLGALWLAESDRLLHWAGLGLLWGFAALTEPIVLAAWPFTMAWSCYGLHRRKMCWIVPLAVLTLALGLAVSPWFVRNYRVFGRFIPFRDNAGLEIHEGNCGETFHWRPRMLGPWHNDQEWQDLKRLGELTYMDREKKLGFDFIRSHPRWFAVVTVRRFVYIWTGFWSFDKRYLAEEPLDAPNVFFCTSLTVCMLVGLRRIWRKDRQLAALFALVLFFFPAIYYVTHVDVCYRRPIDPLILLLALYAFAPKNLDVSKQAVGLESAPCDQVGASSSLR